MNTPDNICGYWIDNDSNFLKDSERVLTTSLLNVTCNLTLNIIEATR